MGSVAYWAPGPKSQGTHLVTGATRLANPVSTPVPNSTAWCCWAFSTSPRAQNLPRSTVVKEQTPGLVLWHCMLAEVSSVLSETWRIHGGPSPQGQGLQWKLEGPSS
jgi:hypothetical protein